MPPRATRRQPKPAAADPAPTRTRGKAKAKPEPEIKPDDNDDEELPDADAVGCDALAEINGIKPKTVLSDGATHEVGSGSRKYTLKRTGGHYHCSCPAWRNQGGKYVTYRTCKHLKELLGAEYEDARCERAEKEYEDGRVDKPAAATKKEDADKEEKEGEEKAPATGTDELAEINSVKPKVLLADGETREAKSASSNSVYRMKRTMDHYYCTCPAWRMAGGGPNARTCKHLKELLGDQYEEERLELADPGSSQKGKSKKSASTKATGKRKAAVDEDENEDEDDNGRPKRKKTEPKRLKDASFKPLLAEKWDLEKGRDPTGWLMSEKLDGVRAYWDGTTFRSREGNPFYAPSWFTARLPTDMTLDGELYTSRNDFQKCVSIVRAQNNPDAWKFSVSYQIFDAPSLGSQPFESRLAELEKRFTGKKAIKWVHVLAHEICKSKEHLFKKLDSVCAEKGEGLMLREPGSTYVNGRSKTLLKVKRFFDDDAVVTGHARGQGKNKDCTGALECEMLEDGKSTGKKFKVGTGLTDKQRRAPPKVGSVIIYRYQELTKDGVPRFPSFVGERAD